ncbi:MAG: hypothetical protein IPG90_03975 [Bacteroidetes bacterium]|nr:hypothetical protein [Bacteroidota bacterium]
MELCFGTDIGVFYLNDSLPIGFLSQDLPAVQVTDCSLPCNEQTSISTRTARGIWKSDMASILNGITVLKRRGSALIESK